LVIGAGVLSVNVACTFEMPLLDGGWSRACGVMMIVGGSSRGSGDNPKKNADGGKWSPTAKHRRPPIRLDKGSWHRYRVRIIAAEATK